MSTGTPAPQTGLTDAVQACVRDMVAAMLAADTRRLDSLLTRDFTLVHMTGYAQPRAEWLAHIDSGRMRYFSAEEVSVAVRGGPRHAQACARHRVRAQIWGMSGTWPLQLDLDLIERDGRWQVRDARASTW